MLQLTGVVDARQMRAQYLDRMDIERERGITIKSQAVRLPYVGGDGRAYVLNLIDTPGHVDFSYEVSRSLAAVEGAVLLVDATQGIQAQTLAHGLAAMEQNLTLIPVINKIDLPQADVEGVKKQLEETFGFTDSEIMYVSGKTGEGVPELLKAVIEKVPAPKQEIEKPLKALIFDSFFDAYKGVVAQVRIME